MKTIDPPLLNSANVWATTEDELEAYYLSQYTGAITIRTSLLRGFDHDDTMHQYCLFDTTFEDVHIAAGPQSVVGPSQSPSSLNTLGYSPVPLEDYIDIVERIQDRARQARNSRDKPVIFSVTGSADDVVKCCKLLEDRDASENALWMVEINLSCPNIPDKPPPAYSKEGLLSYLTALQKHGVRLPVGIKTPPYTYQGQFDDLISALLEASTEEQGSPISFVAATNTLGNCFIPGSLDNGLAIMSANGTGIGGLAGAAS
jgi:dihydroorotate dehydrogenase (fumarate)